MKYKKILTPIICISLLLGGCSFMNQTNDPNSITGENRNEQNEHVFASVQDYTGQGYDLEGGVETDKIAEAHRNEVVQAVKTFFKEKYKTEVKVHNLVGALDGVSVFVESVGEPHFYTFAVVPIDVAANKVLTDKVWSQEDQVEGAIRSGIYAMVYDQKIKNLDNYLKKLTKTYPVVGLRQEAVENVGGNGYSTPYYFLTVIDTAFNVNLNNLYLKNPNRSKDEWEKALLDAKLNVKNVWISLELFMRDSNTEPDKAIFNRVVSDIENMNNLPPGAYRIFLHDNRIGKGSANGSKNNSIELSELEEIIKQ